MESCTEQLSEENPRRKCRQCPQAGEKLTPCSLDSAKPSRDVPQGGRGPDCAKGTIPTPGRSLQWRGVLEAGSHSELPTGGLPSPVPGATPVSATRFYLVFGQTPWFSPTKSWGGGMNSTK